jgi:23S rRNA pseudouridine1911/1915/1917 synthase
MSESRRPEVIYENENFLAVNKPAGLLVHAAVRRHGNKETKMDEPTLVGWLLKKYPQVKNVGDDPALRPGIVHRLDKDTSGVMLVAKTQAYFEYLKSLFQKHEVQKTYYAVVYGVPKNKTGTIDAPIGIKNGTLKRSVRSKKMVKEAVTEYKVLKTWGADASLLEVHPLTGRTHQIRVHLASIGHPIVGDKLYAGKRLAFASRLMLHAAEVEFAPRPGTHLRIEAALPRAFRQKNLSTEAAFAANG